MPGQPEPARHRAQLRLGERLSGAQRLVDGCEHHVLEQLRIVRVDRLRVDLDGEDLAVAAGAHRHETAARGGLDRLRG